MADNRLLASLDALHDELAQTTALDEAGREKLAQISADIQRLLSGTPAAEEASSLTGQLQDAVEGFGASHPRLTAALNQVADALAGLGI